MDKFEQQLQYRLKFLSYPEVREKISPPFFQTYKFSSNNNHPVHNNQKLKKLNTQNLNHQQYFNIQSLSSSKKQKEKTEQQQKQSQLPNNNYQITTYSPLKSAMVMNPLLVELLQSIFPNTLCNENICLKQFLTKAIYFYWGELLLTEQQQKQLLHHCIPLTTTDSQLLSVHALQIFCKKNNLSKFLLNTIIQCKICSANKQVEQKFQFQIQQLRKKQFQYLKSFQEEAQNKINQLKIKIQQLQIKQKKTNDELIKLKKKQNQNQKKHKEKIITMTHQVKNILQTKGKEIVGQYEKMYNEIVNKLEKKLKQFQKSMRYKAQILDRRIQKIQYLKNQQNKSTQNLKNKLKKCQKELQIINKNYLTAVAKYEQEQNILLRSVNLLQIEEKKLSDKNLKKQNKIHKLIQQKNQLQLALKMKQKVSPKKQAFIKQNKSQQKKKDAINKLNTIKVLFEYLSLYQQCFQIQFGNEVQFQNKLIYDNISKQKCISKGFSLILNQTQLNKASQQLSLHFSTLNLFKILISWYVDNPNITPTFPVSIYASQICQVSKLFVLCGCISFQATQWLRHSILQNRQVALILSNPLIYRHILLNTIEKGQLQTIVCVLDLTLAIPASQAFLYQNVVNAFFQMLHEFIYKLTLRQESLLEEVAQKSSIVWQRAIYSLSKKNIPINISQSIIIGIKKDICKLQSMGNNYSFLLANMKSLLNLYIQNK